MRVGNYMKPNNILFLLMGIAILSFGVKIFFNPSYESFRFGSIHFGDYHKLIGIAIITVGVLAAYSAVRRIN